MGSSLISFSAKLRQQSKVEIQQSSLTWEQLDGKAGKQLSFAGIPVKRCDALATSDTASETLITV